ncbi:MAG: DUF6691 family protein [Candidatus Eisenbacteria bacterium]
MRANLATFGFGALFGFVLGWARLHEPETIYRMLRLMEADVFLLMGSAIATATIGVRLLRRNRAHTWWGAQPVSWKTALPARRHVVGSMMFGLGWSIACVCPGPAAVLMGRGEVSGFVTAAGMMIGIAIREALPLAAGVPGATATERPAVGL